MTQYVFRSIPFVSGWCESSCEKFYGNTFTMGAFYSFTGKCFHITHSGLCITPGQTCSLMTSWYCEGSEFILMRGGGCHLPAGINPWFCL